MSKKWKFSKKREIMSSESIAPNSIVAVLTGDIVKSSSLAGERRYFLYESLQEVSTLIKDYYPNDVLFNLAKFRGDGWQLLLSNPQRGFEISLFIRSYIRYKFKLEKLDTRVAIAVGNIDFIPENNVSEGYGRAFSESGRLLDSMKNQRMDFRFTLENESSSNKLVGSLIKTLDAIITNWTAPQCQSVFKALQGFTQMEIAKQWDPKPISQASVANHLKSARWDLINKGNEFFAEMMICHTTNIHKG